MMNLAADLLLCNACGTQYPVKTGKDECKVCDDPRQFVPPEGQTFTTLAQLEQKGHKNVWWQDGKNSKIWFFRTEPQFAIGQRAILLQTSAGNILWDLVPFLDQETVNRINQLGGLKAIVISHPHYYSTWAEWSRTFSCPVHIGKPDEVWLERVGANGTEIRPLVDTYTSILPDSGVTAILAGGHFPGSLLLLWESNLFLADTIVTSPSGKNPVPGKPGVTSFTFLWSIPNAIPMHPDDVLNIWQRLKPLDFHTTYGAFKGMDVYTRDNEAARETGGVKGRLLQSCMIYVAAMGLEQHAIQSEQM